MSKIALIHLILVYSTQFHVAPEISLAVAQNESGFNSRAISSTGDLGVFQLNPKSFPNYTKSQLLDPKTNIMLGVKYLAQMKKECIFKNENEWLICWNYGKKNARKVKHPELFPYIKKINVTMEKFK